MSNPYATPEPANYVSPDAVRAKDASMVNQVHVVGILQIVLGALELFMGAGLFIAAFFVTAAFADISAEVDTGELPPESVMMGMQAYYGIAGGLTSLMAVLRIIGGVGSFWFRGRIWMLVSLIGGLASILTCYCGPFSLGLAIYGLIVMFNPGVKQAYRMAAEGIPASEIRHRFMSAAYGQNPAPPMENPGPATNSPDSAAPNDGGSQEPDS